MRYAPDTRTHRGSATDLANHARCEHLTQLMRARSIAIADGREAPPEAAGVAVDKGREFEAAYVQARRREVEGSGGRFLDVQDSAGGDLERSRQLLEQAMRDGVELIAQAPMRAGEIFGYADLLERVADASEPGGRLRSACRYEPVEVKYARSVKPEHLLQASAYADVLERLQGELPGRIHVVVASAEGPLRVPHATSEYVEYFRAARERFAAALTLDLAEQLQQVPDPVPHCARCGFAPHCDQRRRDADHLSLVAGIRADQRAKLSSVGIGTLTALATTGLERVPGIGRDTFPRLVEQARLQLAARDMRLPGVAYRHPRAHDHAGRGFALLPEPDREDMFFDFEGYPYHESGALEYLWGWTSRGANGELRFDHLWADTPAEERAAFTRFLDEVHARREGSPGMHVFHYAPYEITALRRLARQHPSEQPRLDQLLRAGVFVDLYAVVRQAMLVGTDSYSIKRLEPLYGISRLGDELADGGASIEVYEQWLLAGDGRVRATIIDYNRVDCDSTLALRDWLLEHRDAARARGIEWPTPSPTAQLEDPAGEADREGQEASQPHPARVLVERLEAVAGDEQQPQDLRLAARLLSAMPGWQRRVTREFWGDLHGRKHERDVDDLVTDPVALSGLQLIDECQPPKARAGTLLRRYSFPPQVTLVDAGARAIDPIQVADVGCIDSIDLDECIVGIRTTAGDAAQLAGRGHQPVPGAIVAWKDINAAPLERAAARVAQQLVGALDAGADPFDPAQPCAAALSMLGRHATRVVAGPGPEQLDQDPDPERLADLVGRAEGSHVIVQGPPGTGKTWTSARLVAALVRAGLRVGISSNSHDAVINVLCGIDEYRAECARAGTPLQLRAGYALRTDEKAPGTLPFGHDWIQRGTSEQVAAAAKGGDVQVLAGTAWQLSREVPLDAVLVDEAGQVSLLHATAMASSARRVVLVGDPQQLPQPATVQHPFGCGSSVLEHLFEGAAVLPPERAVLLPTTRRMHPRVCSFISDTYYAGELQPHPDTARQRVTAAALPPSGVHLVRVEHRGNRTHSGEEVEAVRDIVARLLDGGRVVPHPTKPERPIEPCDIIVVAPYNAQRRALQRALGADVAVGTVDKFQGQEAPISILSLTASSREELPRGLEFLLDPHRLNVAISRARALAIVVASPALLATPATSLHEMRLLNDLARLERIGG